MKYLLSAALILGAASAQAATLYQADFTQFVSIDHTNTGNALEPSTQAGANFEIGYSGTPASDSTRNFFETDGDSLISSDFGGTHFMRSDTIDVGAWATVAISATANFIGLDSFNNSPTEFFEYIFQLDGGLDTSFFFFTDDPNGTDLNAVLNLDVSAANSLIVGLNANANGAGDGFDLTSFSVQGITPSVAVVPLPAGILLTLSGLFALGVNRSRRTV